MAEHHLSVKKGSRAKGQSAIARAAYRAGEKLHDQRTGLTHDFSRKSGVIHTEILLPPGAPPRLRDRETLWNTAEAAEKRKDSAIDREWELALPHELDDDERLAIAQRFGSALVGRYGLAVDLAIHRPSRHGDTRNHHVHLKGTTRRISDKGFGGKTEILDSPRTSAPEIQWAHEKACELINSYLIPKGLAPIDWRKLEVRRDEAVVAGRMDDAIELSRPAQRHVGVSATAMARRGIETDRQQARAACQAQAQEAHEAANEYREILQAIADDPLNIALAAPSIRISNEQTVGRLARGRVRVAAAAVDLTQPPPSFEPLGAALAGPARPGRSSSRLAASRIRVAAAAGALAEGADRREGNDRSAGARGDLERAKPSTSERAEPSRTAMGEARRSGPGDRAAAESVCPADRPAPTRNQIEPALVRGAAGDAAAQAILSRPSPALPPRDQPAMVFSQKGPGGPDQVRRARDAIHDKALNRLKERLKQWVLRAFDVVAGRQRPPERLPEGMEGKGYEAGLRLGKSHPAAVADPSRCQVAAERIARDLVDTQRSAAVVRSPVVINKDRERS